MVNALEDYHPCTSCGTPVHDYGPDADAECINGQWFHTGCATETREWWRNIIRNIDKILAEPK